MYSVRKVAGGGVLIAGNCYVDQINIRSKDIWAVAT